MKGKKEARIESAVTRQNKPQPENLRNHQSQPQIVSSNEIISINKLKSNANLPQSRNQVVVQNVQNFDPKSVYYDLGIQNNLTNTNIQNLNYRTTKTNPQVNSLYFKEEKDDESKTPILLKQSGQHGSRKLISGKTVKSTIDSSQDLKKQITDQKQLINIDDQVKNNYLSANFLPQAQNQKFSLSTGFQQNIKRNAGLQQSCDKKLNKQDSKNYIIVAQKLKYEDLQKIQKKEEENTMINKDNQLFSENDDQSRKIEVQRMISCNLKLLKDKELESYNILQKHDNNIEEKGRQQCSQLQSRLNMLKQESVNQYFNEFAQKTNESNSRSKDNFIRISSNAFKKEDFSSEINNLNDHHQKRKNIQLKNILKQKKTFSNILQKRNVVGPIELIETKIQQQVDLEIKEKEENNNFDPQLSSRVKKSDTAIKKMHTQVNQKSQNLQIENIQKFRKSQITNQRKNSKLIDNQLSLNEQQKEIKTKEDLVYQMRTLRMKMKQIEKGNCAQIEDQSIENKQKYESMREQLKNKIQDFENEISQIDQRIKDSSLQEEQAVLNDVYRRQQKTILNFYREEKKRNKFQNFVTEKMGQIKRQSLFDVSDNYRVKVESSQLCELGSSLFEKYGPESAWKLCLRTNYEIINDSKQSKLQSQSRSEQKLKSQTQNITQNFHHKDDGNLIIMNNKIGNQLRGITSTCIDDRTKTISIIRKAQFDDQNDHINQKFQINRLNSYSLLDFPQNKNENQITVNNNAQRLQSALSKKVNFRKMPTLLKNCLSLNTISSSVLQKYSDQPQKLMNHLPFAEVKSKNNGWNFYNQNSEQILKNNEFEAPDEEIQLNDDTEKKSNIVTFKGQKGSILDIAEDNESFEIKNKQEEFNVYSEKNLKDLKIIGKSVYQQEKQALYKIFNQLLKI